MIWHLVGFLLIFQASISFGSNWNLTDVHLLIEKMAFDVSAYCIILVTSEEPSDEEGKNNFIIAEMLSKGRGNFPICSVGVSSYRHDDIRRTYDNCAKPLFLVMENDETTRNLEELSKSYFFTNSLWVIFAATSSLSGSHYQNVNLPINSGFAVAKMSSDSSEINIYTVYQIAPENPMKLQYIGTWSREKGMKLTAFSVLKRGSNLEGVLLKTASLENWPMTSFTYGLQSSRNISGFMAHLWFDLERHLNFTSLNLRSIEQVSGRELESGEWNGILGMAARKEVDVLLTDTSMTPSRLKVVDFIQPFYVTRNQVYFRFNGFVINWISFLKPFDTYVWLVIVLWIIVGALMLYFFERIFCHYTLDVDPSDRSPVQKAFFVLQTFCSQATNEIPEAFSLRWLFLICYLVGSVILPSYSAALISALANKTPDRPYDSLEELLLEKTPLLVWKNTADFEKFSKSTGDIYAALMPFVNPLQEMKNLENYGDMFEYICKHPNVAMFGVESSIDFLGWQRIKRDNKCYALKFTKPLALVHQTMAVVKNSPFRDPINFHMMIFRERGLLRRRYFQFFFPLKEENNVPIVVYFPEVASIFAILGFGIIIALLILLGECYHFHNKLDNRQFAFIQ